MQSLCFSSLSTSLLHSIDRFCNRRGKSSCRVGVGEVGGFQLVMLPGCNQQLAAWSTHAILCSALFFSSSLGLAKLGNVAGKASRIVLQTNAGAYFHVIGIYLETWPITLTAKWLVTGAVCGLFAAPPGHCSWYGSIQSSNLCVTCGWYKSVSAPYWSHWFWIDLKKQEKNNWPSRH